MKKVHLETAVVAHVDRRPRTVAASCCIVSYTPLRSVNLISDNPLYFYDSQLLRNNVHNVNTSTLIMVFRTQLGQQTAMLVVQYDALFTKESASILDDEITN